MIAHNEQLLSSVCNSKIGKKFSREKIEALQRSSKKTCEEVRSQIDEADRIYKQETIFKILNLKSVADCYFRYIF